MKSFARFTALAAVAFAILGPARGEGARKDMEILQSDVDEIQRQVYDLKALLDKQTTDMAELLRILGKGAPARSELAGVQATLESLEREIRGIRAGLDDVAGRMSTLERKTAPCERGAESVSPPLAAPAAPAPSGPSEALYQQAYGDYIRDKFDLAVSEFREYIDTNSSSDLADNAQYWIAMCSFNQSKWADAIREFDELLRRWPEADNAPEASYRRGVALAELSLTGQAVLQLNDVVSRYPESPAAAQAREYLRTIASESRTGAQR